MDFNKNYKEMTLEEKRSDPDWSEMTPLERMAAIGVLRDIDGSEITLEEQYNQRFKVNTQEEIEEYHKKVMDYLHEKRKKRAEKNALKLAQEQVNKEFEELLK